MFLVVVLLGLAQGGIVRDYVNNIINNALSNIHSINRINEIVNNAVNNIQMAESVGDINNITNEIVNNAVNNIKIVESVGSINNITNEIVNNAVDNIKMIENVGGINNITNEIVNNAVNNIKIVESINNLTSNAVNNINDSVLNTISSNAVNSISADGVVVNVNRIVVVDNNSSTHDSEGSNHIDVEATTDKILVSDYIEATEQTKVADDMEDAAYQMMIPDNIEDTTDLNLNRVPDHAEDAVDLIMVPDFTEVTTDQNDGIDYEEDTTHQNDVTEAVNNLNILEEMGNFEEIAMQENIEDKEEHIDDMEANDMECITGWTYFPHTGLCYKHYTSWKLYWDQARTFCQSSGPGGDLASVPDLATNLFLAALTGSYAWIGATDGGSEGGWRWSDGSPWTFTNWAPSPAPGPGSHYGAINWLAPGVWNQGDTARRQQNFICQYVAVELIF